MMPWNNYSKRKKFSIILLGILVLGFLVPQDLQMPVQGATRSDYNAESFWYYPWGQSVTHKGVDIFAKTGTSIHSATHGIVLYAGNIPVGGNIVVALGPKWRLHYYAHLDALTTSSFSLVGKSTQIGTVGSTGNAAGKPAHLHYSIMSMIPYPWRANKGPHGWRKMFYLNPIKYIEAAD